MDLFAFEVDDRNPSDNYRKARFREGWQNAVTGQAYSSATLKKLTWDNLGYRLGKLFGETSDQLIDEMHEWCVRQHNEK